MLPNHSLSDFQVDPFLRHEIPLQLHRGCLIKKIRSVRCTKMCRNVTTRDLNMLSWVKIWEFPKWQCDVIDDVIITKIITLELIFMLIRILQPDVKYYNNPKMAANRGFGWSWKPEVKSNGGCHSNIPIRVLYILFLLHLDTLTIVGTTSL